MVSAQDLQDYAVKIASAAIIKSAADLAELDKKEARVILGLFFFAAGSFGLIAANDKVSVWILFANGVAVIGLLAAAVFKHFSSSFRTHAHSLSVLRSVVTRNEGLWTLTSQNIQKDCNQGRRLLFNIKEAEIDELKRILTFMRSITFSEAVALLAES